MISTNKAFQVAKYSAIATVFTVALSGCSLSLSGDKQTQSDPDINKIVVWSFEDEDVWKPIKRDFEAQNKGYTLEYQKQRFDSTYENRLLNSGISTQKPDIWAMPNDWVYRHKEKLYPMPAELAKTINLDDQFYPAIKQSVYFDNNIYALSPTVDPLIVYYNDELMLNTQNQLTQLTENQEEQKRISSLLYAPPKTWSDFTEAAKLLTKKNGNNIEISGVALGTTSVTDAQDILYLLMMQNETDVISSNAKLATFNLPKSTSTGSNDIPGKRALEFFTSFADPKSANYTWNDSLGNCVDAFASGKVAMMIGYSSLQNTLLQKYPGIHYQKAYVPQVSLDTTKITDFARFTAFGVSRLSKNPSAAWTILNAYIINNTMEPFSTSTRLFTSKMYDTDNLTIENRDPGNPEKLTLVTAKALVKGRYPEEFNNEIRSAINNVNRGIQDSKSALDLAANNITELLRKETW